jgi:DNA-binding NarL/FixJ family response regulator
MIRLLILAEVGLYLEALAQSLKRDEGIEIVGIVASLEETIATLRKNETDIVLVDTLMPAGAEAVRALVTAAPQVEVVVLAVPEDGNTVIAFAEAGASGYVVRDGSMEDLVEVIKSASRGEMLCSPGIAATLARRVAVLARERRMEPIQGRLTARELDVLRLIEEGLSNKQIATALSIELPTVKNHVHSILRKLNVHRRAEAAARARRHGLGRLGALASDD